MGPMREFEKSKYAFKDYGFNWTKWLAGDAIDTATWIATPAGLTLSNETTTTTASSVYVSGGQVGKKYTLTCRIVTTAATPRKDSRYIAITVVE